MHKAGARGDERGCRPQRHDARLPQRRGRRAHPRGGPGGPVAHRPHAALQPGHLHQGVRHHPRPVRLDARRPAAAATPPGHFSFNIPGGRCETCQGDGTVTVEMQFLADVELVCEECKGTRYKSGVLEVRYRGLNIHEVLQLTVKEALAFFADVAPAGGQAAGAGAGRAGLPAAGPVGDHALGRRGAARETGRAPGPGLLRRRAVHLRRADHRPALRRHRQAARRLPDS